MRVEFYQPAAEDERYAPRAFDGLIGQDAPFKINGTERGSATVVAVVVDGDGGGATWTVDIEDVADLAKHPIPGLAPSFAPTEGLSFTTSPAIPARWWE